MENNNAIVLLSGGLDSVCSLAAVRSNFENMLALTFNYSQKSYESEIESSSLIAKFYNIKHIVIDLPWLGEISNSALNTDESLPVLNKTELDNKFAAQKTADSVWVPNRNGLFVNIAAAYAEARNYTHIIIGANKEEGATFKDNTVEFINAVNNSLLNSTNTNIKLIAPLIDKSKSEIVKLALDLNIPLELIHSCYLNKKKHCGKCESCLRLKRALELNNRHDIIEKIFE